MTCLDDQLPRKLTTRLLVLCLALFLPDFYSNYNQLEMSNGTRIRNKARRTVPRYNWGQEPEFDTIFSLARHGYRLPASVRDEGSDVEEDPVDDEFDDIDMTVTKLWRQFLLDVTSKAPNGKYAHSPSHCILNEEQRSIVTEETYKNSIFSSYFRDCQWKIARDSDWERTFTNIFPPISSPQRAGNTQNYGSTQYFLQWAVIKGRADEDTCSRIWGELKARSDTLYWKPYAQRDRLWYTKFDARFTKSSGIDRKEPSPQVLINLRTNDPLPIW